MKQDTNREIEQLRAENALLRLRVAELEAMLPAPPPSPSLNKEEQAFLDRCREITDQNLRNESFSIDSMAGIFAMSHSSMYKKVRALTGHSVKDFISDRRILKACQYFKDGITNVSAVAELCGYKDIKTFRATFKKRTGLTPKQYCLTHKN